MAAAPPATLPPQATLPRPRTIVILGALSTFGPLSMDMYLPGLPELTRDLSAQAWATQLSITACMIGLAAGQLVAGPLSDRLGRRGPLLAGLAAYAVTSALCAMAPSIWWLLLLRLGQGMAGAAGIVIARAVVRDLYEGRAAARIYSLLMLVAGLAPILAPLLGGQLLHVTDWRGVFLALSAIGIVLFLATTRWLEESLAPEHRHSGGLSPTLHVFGRLLRDRGFVGYALAMALSFSAMAAYIAGSSFVLEDVYGMSPQLFSLTFAVNAAGIIAMSQLGGRVVERVGPRVLLDAGVRASAVGGLGLLAAVVFDAGLTGVLPSLFVIVATMGLVLPNSTALALHDYPRAAGSASALFGLAQFALGGAVAPLAGVAGGDTALPLAITAAVLGVGSALVLPLLRR
jgi:DHA1 family bicyclomycin/chloramphenicol resistance-like MFS transporter